MSTVRSAIIYWTFARAVLAAPMTPAATNPISVQTSILLGNQTSTNIPGTYRDGGWEGQIGSTYFQLYADTLHCSDTSATADCNGFIANSVALPTSDPQLMTDFSGSDGLPPQFCDSSASGYRLHATNIVSLSSTTGLVWYGNVSQPGIGGDIDGAIVGAGVATITYNGLDSPSCDPLPQIWGVDEPNFGIYGAQAGNLDGYIYLYGTLGSETPGFNDNDVFVARVNPAIATDPAAYEYWTGSAWTSTRLTYPDYNGYAPAAVMGNVAQGSIFYSNYYLRYVYLYPYSVPYNTVTMAITSLSPVGPWSEPVPVYNATTLTYIPAAQPHFDPSGKTLVVDISNFDGSYTSTLKLTFD